MKTILITIFFFAGIICSHAQDLKTLEAISEKKAALIVKELDSLRKMKTSQEMFDIIYKTIIKEVYIDFYAAYHINRSLWYLTADSAKLLKSKLPQNVQNGFQLMNSYGVEKMYEAQYPHMKSKYPAQLPMPGQLLLSSAVATLPDKYNKNKPAENTVPKPAGPTVAKTTTNQPKLNLTAEQQKQLQNKTGYIYKVKGAKNIYDPDNPYGSVHFYVTHTDGTYFYGITRYTVRQEQGGSKYQGQVRKSGQVLVQEKQFADHPQFWDAAYRAGTCNRAVKICQTCKGSGNGATRNSKRTYTKYETNRASSYYGKRVEVEEMVYDYYPCKTCKGEGWFDYK